MTQVYILSASFLTVGLLFVRECITDELFLREIKSIDVTAVSKTYTVFSTFPFYMLFQQAAAEFIFYLGRLKELFTLF